MCDDALLQARILTLPHYISHLENSLRGVQMYVKAVPNINIEFSIGQEWLWSSRSLAPSGRQTTFRAFP